MKIIDLDESNKDLYFVCLEDWSDEMKEAGNHKECWYQKVKNKGLRVKLAVDDNDAIGGMIQYMPIEETFAIGENMYFIYCIWVHGYKEGRGNFRKQGMGKALINAAEDDVKNLGADALVAWGLSIPVWMKARWFKKQGYKKVDKTSMQVLLWKPFNNKVKQPKWIKRTEKKFYTPRKDKVTITAFKTGWCPAQNIVYERTLRACNDFKEKIEFIDIDTNNRENYLKYGLSDKIFINNKLLRSGPPPSYKKIRQKIEKAVKKLKF